MNMNTIKILILAIAAGAIVLVFSAAFIVDETEQVLVTRFDKVNRSAEGLLGILNDILDLTKIEAGQMDVYPDQVDVEALIDQLDQRTPQISIAAKTGARSHATSMAQAAAAPSMGVSPSQITPSRSRTSRSTTATGGPP